MSKLEAGMCAIAAAIALGAGAAAAGGRPPVMRAEPADQGPQATEALECQGRGVDCTQENKCCDGLTCTQGKSGAFHCLP